MNRRKSSFVLSSYRTNDSARIARRDNARRYILSDHASRAYNNVAAHGNARQYRHVAAYPYVVAYRYARRIQQYESVIGIKILADKSIIAVVAVERRFNKKLALSTAEYLFHQGFSLLPVRRRDIVVFETPVLYPLSFLCQLRVVIGIVEKPRLSFFPFQSYFLLCGFFYTISQISRYCDRRELRLRGYLVVYLHNVCVVVGDFKGRTVYKRYRFCGVGISSPLCNSPVYSAVSVSALIKFCFRAISFSSFVPHLLLISI